MEGQITQWSKDIKGAIRSCKWRDRYHNDQKISKGQSEAVNGGTDNTITKRYQRGNQKLEMEGQITQWSTDIKGTIRSCKWSDICWSLCYLSLHLQLLIAPLISFDHCVICPSIYSFWLPLWYLLVIVLSVPPFTASDQKLSKGESEAVNGGTDNTMIKRYQRSNQKL
jgi:hypothetical protein